MTKATFKACHINANEDDLTGNDGVGRYILIPGSDARAKEIAKQFDDLTVKSHGRGHHLYLGSIDNRGKKIKVAAIASGMGCPSMEIILHELFKLGAKRFLRVGTAGSLQINRINVGSIINVTACVRDEATTLSYAPIEFPAIASYDMISAVQNAAQQLQLQHPFYTGIVHCKSSYYAREFGAGPRADEHHQYMNLLTRCGVLATEMESAALFIQSQIYDHELKQTGVGPACRVHAGTIVGVLSISPHTFATDSEAKIMTDNLINLSLETIKQLSDIDGQ